MKSWLVNLLLLGDPLVKSPVEAFIMDIVFIETDTLVVSSLNNLCRICKAKTINNQGHK